MTELTKLMLDLALAESELSASRYHNRLLRKRIEELESEVAKSWRKGMLEAIAQIDDVYQQGIEDGEDISALRLLDFARDDIRSVMNNCEPD